MGEYYFPFCFHWRRSRALIFKALRVWTGKLYFFYLERESTGDEKSSKKPKNLLRRLSILTTYLPSSSSSTYFNMWAPPALFGVFKIVDERLIVISVNRPINQWSADHRFHQWWKTLINIGIGLADYWDISVLIFFITLINLIN